MFKSLKFSVELCHIFILLNFDILRQSGVWVLSMSLILFFNEQLKHIIKNIFCLHDSASPRSRISIALISHSMRQTICASASPHAASTLYKSLTFHWPAQTECALTSCRKNIHPANTTTAAWAWANILYKLTRALLIKIPCHFKAAREYIAYACSMLLRCTHERVIWNFHGPIREETMRGERRDV